ncbi:sigma-70 family RNA polymerase sigma factor [Sphingobacterium daejeonense]|uniref:sigma-70 family RNA polymerase sigma factor n=1 Tax=Sphingobacterium daejeonense TaxID=371142 RepID=UPI0010C2DBE4|nr:sigma-70 family RNA polymerase sigma factor [Sphingobacterium daejeonense]VTQ08327.1 RNA polymerase sigma factor [Sphingobacterium daejeonense]
MNPLPSVSGLSWEDYDLVSRLKNNDKTAFSEIYFKYWENFFDSSYSFLRDEELAKDVLHDVFLDIWRIRHKLEIRYSIKAYLSVCIKNKCIFVLKERKKVEMLNIDSFDIMTSEYDQLALKDIEFQLNHVLKNKLTKKSRTIFELNRNEDLTYKEIAGRMNLSIKSVEYHMSKVLSLLKKSILIITTSILFF